MSAGKVKKPFYKKWWVWLLAIIVVIAITSGGDDTPTEKATDKAEPKTEEKSKAKEEVVAAGIGEVVKVGDVEFTVNETTTAKNVGGEYGSDAKGTFLIVDVTVTNLGTEAITTDSSFFKLKVGEKTYEADSSASISADMKMNFFYEEINPDLSSTGKVVFDVSDAVIASPELMLQVQSGFWGTENGLINIAK